MKILYVKLNSGEFEFRLGSEQGTVLVNDRKKITEVVEKDYP